MGKKTTSKTEEKLSFINAITGVGPHYETTITDGDRTVGAEGFTSETSQKRASEKWAKK